MKVPSRAFKSEVIYSGKILIVEETHDKKKEEVNQKMCERERSSGFLSIICFFSNPSSEKRNAFSFSSRERKTAENNDHKSVALREEEEKEYPICCFLLLK